MKQQHEKVIKHILNNPVDSGWQSYTVKDKPDNHTARAHFKAGRLHNAMGPAVWINDNEPLFYLEGVEIDADEFWNQNIFWDSRFGTAK